MSSNSKSFSLLLILILAVSGLTAIFATIPFELAQTGTNVTGILSSNTTWTQGNSPYTLTGPILVSGGVVLTIQAGTMVNLGNYYIEVDGTLQAIGSSLNPITFNSPYSGQINFTQYSSSWNQQMQTGCVIENAVLTCSINIYQVSPLISKNQFSYPMGLFTFAGGPGVSVYGGSPLILNNTSNSYFDVYDEGLALISNNTLSGEYAGIGCFSQNSEVIDNTLSGCGLAIGFGGPGIVSSGTVEGNLIYQNQVGIYVDSGQAVIENNTIANNTIGIQLPSASSTIIYNNLLNNQLSISLINTGTNTLQSNNINPTYNYWGTTDTQAINQTIFDFKDNFNLGTVDFVPFLTTPNAQAPSLPTPTPTPSLSPSPSPTSAPTRTLITQTTPTSTPTVPEFPALMILPLFAVMILFLIVFARKRNSVNRNASD